MTTTGLGDGRAEFGEIHAYIVDMANELAKMADKIDMPDLAERLRLAVWPDEKRVGLSKHR